MTAKSPEAASTSTRTRWLTRVTAGDHQTFWRPLGAWR